MSVVQLRVCGRYKLQERIGKNTFSKIFQGQNVQNNHDVAIKIEQIKTRHPQLLYEGKILQTLQGGRGIPIMHWCGQEGDYNFYVMQYLGYNLEQLLKQCGGTFSLKTVLLLFDEILSIMQYLHFKAYIHRDIKTENFIFGVGKKIAQLNLIDYGLAKRYRDTRTYEHIPFRDKKPMIGTARFASINAHKGHEISRRDDLEAIGYMIVYLFKGTLPWQGINMSNKEEKYQKIKEKKMNTKIEELCAGMPREFAIYINYVKSLQFEEKPDYNFCRKIMKERFYSEGYVDDGLYDWFLIPQKLIMPKFNFQIPIVVDVIEREKFFLSELPLNQEYMISQFNSNQNNGKSQIEEGKFRSQLMIDEIQRDGQSQKEPRVSDKQDNQEDMRDNDGRSGHQDKKQDCAIF